MNEIGQPLRRFHLWEGRRGVGRLHCHAITEMRGGLCHGLCGAIAGARMEVKDDVLTGEGERISREGRCSRTKGTRSTEG